LDKVQYTVSNIAILKHKQTKHIKYLLGLYCNRDAEIDKNYTGLRAEHQSARMSKITNDGLTGSL